VLDPITVTALPLAVQPTLDVVGPPGFTAPDLSTAPVHISAGTKPVGTGTVTLVAPTSNNAWVPVAGACNDSQGHEVTVAASCFRVPLTFQDSDLGGTNTARPGTYQFSVAVDGFVPSTFYLQCTFGDMSCSFTAAPGGTPTLPSVMRRPTITADFSLPTPSDLTPANLDPAAWKDAWTTATAQQQAGSTSLGAISVVGDNPTLEDTDDGSGVIVQTVKAINAHLTFGSSNQTTILAPNAGDYAIDLSKVLSFQTPVTLTISCPGDDFRQVCTTAVNRADAYPTFDSAGSIIALDDVSNPGNPSAPFKVEDVSVAVSPASQYLSVEVGADGHITWDDQTPGLLKNQNQATPGDYTLTFTLPGFASSQPTLIQCPTTGSCDPVNITLKRLPYIYGTLTIPLADSATSVTIPPNAITVTSSSGSNVTVTTPSTVTGASGTDVTAKMTWMDSAVGVAGLVTPANYTATVSLDGYQDLTLHCDVSGAPTGNECDTSGTLTLDPQPAGMKLTILPGTTVTPTLDVTNPKGTAKVTATVDTSGNITWKQKGATGVVTPSDLPYTLTAAINSDYQMSSKSALVPPVDFYCRSTTDCKFPQIVLTKKTDLTVNIVDNAGATITSNARIALGGSATSSPITQNGSAIFIGTSTAGVMQTNNIWSDDSYTLSANAAGYRFVSGLGSTASSVSCTNGTNTLPGVHLFPGGTTTCTVTLTAAGAITGITKWDTVSLQPTTHGPGTAVLPNVTLTATKDGDTTPTTESTSGTDGSFTLTGTVSSGGDVEGLPVGKWTIKASPANYFDLVSTVTVACTNTATDNEVGGYCIDGAYTVSIPTSAASTTSSYLTLSATSSGQQVIVHLVPKPADLTAVFTSDHGAAALPSGTVTLTDTFGGSWACTIPTAQSGEHCTTDTTSITFTDVPPGSYNIGITFDNNKYSSIVKIPVTLAAGGNATPTPISITARINTVSGFVTDSTGAGINDAKVTLCSTASCTTPANDFDGNAFPVQTTPVTGGAAGSFKFTNVADGTYYLKATHGGYSVNTPIAITVNFDNQFPQPQTIVLSATVRQAVSMTFKLPSGVTGLSLTGASVTLTQTDYDGRTIPSQPVVLTAPNIIGTGAPGSPFTSTYNQLPTGMYAVSVSPNSAQAPFALSAGTLTVTEGTGTLNANLTLTATPVTFEVTSSDDNQLLPADVPFTLSLNGTSATPSLQMTRATDNKSASATINLPEGSFTWTPALSGSIWDGWSGGSGNTATVDSSGTVSGNSATLTAPTPTVKVTVTEAGGTTPLSADQSVTVAFVSGSGTTTADCGTSKTDSTGTVACTGLAPSESYGVTATWTEPSTSDVYVGYQAVTTDSVGNGAVSVNLAATPSALITVTDDSNLSVASAGVTVYKSDGSVFTSGTPDEAGNVYITGLTANDNYYAVASTAAKKSKFFDFTATANLLSKSSVELTASVSITVTVSDKNGPLDGVTVDIALNAQNSILLGTAQTDINGKATISNLPAGETVDATASISGYGAETKNAITLGNSANSDSITLVANTPPAPTTVSLTMTVSIAGGGTFPSDLAMTLNGPDPANSGSSKIFTGQVNTTTEKVTFTGLSPTGSYLVAATSGSGTVTTYAADPSSAQAPSVDGTTAGTPSVVLTKS
jgi:hypothetical protein